MTTTLQVYDNSKLIYDSSKVTTLSGGFDSLHTSDRVAHIAGKGFRDGKLTPDEIKELCGSVLRHIEAQHKKR